MRTDPSICVEAFSEKNRIGRRVFKYALNGVIIVVLIAAFRPGHLKKDDWSMAVILLGLVLFEIFFERMIPPAWICSVCKSDLTESRQPPSECPKCGAQVGKPFVQKKQ